MLLPHHASIPHIFHCFLQIQERLLNNTGIVDVTQGANVRAESVPPNVVCTNQSAYLPRAQSEQPQFQPNFGPTQQQQTNAAAANIAVTSPFRQYTNACQNGQLYRNLQGARLLGHSNALLNSRPIAPRQQQQQQQSQSVSQATYYETDQSFSNNYLNPQNPGQSVLLNNDPNSPLLNTASAAAAAQCQQQSPIFLEQTEKPQEDTQAVGSTCASLFQLNFQNTAQANRHSDCNHNNNTAASATAVPPHGQKFCPRGGKCSSNAVTSTTSSAAAINNNHNNNIANMNNSRAFSPQVPALNNQVPPGNLTRANNYWDNFRR